MAAPDPQQQRRGRMPVPDPSARAVARRRQTACIALALAQAALLLAADYPSLRVLAPAVSSIFATDARWAWWAAAVLGAMLGTVCAATTHAAGSRGGAAPAAANSDATLGGSLHAAAAAAAAVWALLMPWAVRVAGPLALQAAGVLGGRDKPPDPEAAAVALALMVPAPLYFLLGLASAGAVYRAGTGTGRRLRRRQHGEEEDNDIDNPLMALLVAAGTPLAAWGLAKDGYDPLWPSYPVASRLPLLSVAAAGLSAMLMPQRSPLPAARAGAATAAAAAAAAAAGPAGAAARQRPRQQRRRLRWWPLPRPLLLLWPVVAALAGCRLYSGPAVPFGVTAPAAEPTAGADGVDGDATVSKGGKQTFEVLQAIECRHGGYLSVVGATLNGQYKYAAMRYDRSLLGGLYSHPEDVAGSSIYTAFYLQDTVWLFNKGARTALTIGLGVGFASSVLQSRGVSVDVVELHPEVYAAAVDHFKYVPNGEVYLEDALQVVPRMLQDPARGPGHYGLIIHDVFAGGGVPPSLFSRTLLVQLRTLLAPGGVIAVNYVGLASDARPVGAALGGGGATARAGRCVDRIASELRRVFGHVRAFVDAKDDGGGGDDDLTDGNGDDGSGGGGESGDGDGGGGGGGAFLKNYVFFASARPLAPAKPTAADVAGDPSRGQYLFHLFEYEVHLLQPPPPLGSDTSSNDGSMFAAGGGVGQPSLDAQGDGSSSSKDVCFGAATQREVARAHWRAMGAMYPAEYWARAY